MDTSKTTENSLKLWSSFFTHSLTNETTIFLSTIFFNKENIVGSSNTE